jgi:hypothetical protein
MNRLPILMSLAMGLFAAGCNRCCEETTRFHDDGRAKPVVAVASMIDTTNFDAPWSLSDEFTSSIANQVAANGEIYVQAQEDCPFTENPFDADLSWMKREFKTQEFLVFLELVEHGIVPAVQGKKQLHPNEASTNLEMAVRVRVVDLRGSTPKIVLQEMVRDTYFIPRSILPPDYSLMGWGTEEYFKTPMGIAHSQFAQEIARRVSDYILLAKSR